MKSRNEKREKVLINYERLREFLGFDSYDMVKTAHGKWVESYLKNGNNFRKDKWTESIPFGSEHFIGHIKALLGGMASGRSCMESGESMQLRETQNAYITLLRPKRAI